MLIKVNKELTQLVVIRNGNKYRYDLSVSYNLRPASKTPTVHDFIVGKRVAEILENANLPIGAFVGRNESTEETDYDIVAKKSI